MKTNTGLRAYWPFVAVVAAVVVALPEVWIDYPPWMRDGLRVVELVESSMVAAVTAGVGYRYWQNFKADPSSARLLPRHVVLMATGVIALTLAVVAGVIHLIGYPFVWYVTPLVLPSMTALLTGLYDMITWLPNRSAPPVNAARRSDDPLKHNRTPDG